MFCWTNPKKVSVPSQQYFNGAYMEKPSIISPLNPDKGKNQWHVLVKNKLRAYSIKNPGTNNIHTIFYSNISEFAGNLEEMLDDGTYKTTIQNMYKLVWKAQYFKYSDLSVLGLLRIYHWITPKKSFVAHATIL